MIYLILTLFFLLSLFFVSPLLVVQLKAKSQGAKISLKEAFGYYNRKTAKKSIFRAISVNQDEGLNIDPIQLETHFLSGGNPELLINAWLKFKDQKGITFQMLSAVDLAYRNLNELIESGIEEHKIQISKYDTPNFSVNLKVRFFYPLGARQKKLPIESIEKEIKQKLHQFGLKWGSTNIEETKEFLIRNEFNSDYWTNILCLNLVEQKIDLKRL